MSRYQRLYNDFNFKNHDVWYRLDTYPSSKCKVDVHLHHSHQSCSSYRMLFHIFLRHEPWSLRWYQVLGHRIDYMEIPILRDHVIRTVRTCFEAVGSGIWRILIRMQHLQRWRHDLHRRLRSQPSNHQYCQLKKWISGLIRLNLPWKSVKSFSSTGLTTPAEATAATVPATRNLIITGLNEFRPFLIGLYWHEVVFSRTRRLM